MGANTDTAGPAREPTGGREREQWLIAEAHRGSGWALAALATTYQPMVYGYLLCLTGAPEAARSLTRQTLARMEQHFAGSAGAPSLAAWLLLTATESGLAYLRHARALQLAGVGGEPRVQTVPSRGGPTAWLRAAFERFRPLADGDDARSAPARGVATDTRAGRPAEATRRLRPRNGSGAATAVDPRDLLRRRVLRATLADLAPPVARCLALHLIAGLSHHEVAYVSGMNPHVAAAALVKGIEFFAVRYDDALELLGISPSLFADTALPHPGALGSPAVPTLPMREGAAPTRQLPGGSRQRGPSPTTPRHVARALPAPRAPRPTPVTTSAGMRPPRSSAPPRHPPAASRPDATPTVSLRAVRPRAGQQLPPGAPPQPPYYPSSPHAATR